MKPRNILKVIDDEAKDVSLEERKKTLVIVVNPFDFKLPIISVYDSLFKLKAKKDLRPELITQCLHYSDKVELHRISRNILVLVETMPEKN